MERIATVGAAAVAADDAGVGPRRLSRTCSADAKLHSSPGLRSPEAPFDLGYPVPARWAYGQLVGNGQPGGPPSGDDSDWGGARSRFTPLSSINIFQFEPGILGNAATGEGCAGVREWTGEAPPLREV